MSQSLIYHDAGKLPLMPLPDVPTNFQKGKHVVLFKAVAMLILDR
jgi:hypothetical protein